MENCSTCEYNKRHRCTVLPIGIRDTTVISKFEEEFYKCKEYKACSNIDNSKRILCEGTSYDEDK